MECKRGKFKVEVRGKYVFICLKPNWNDVMAGMAKRSNQRSVVQAH